MDVVELLEIIEEAKHRLENLNLEEYLYKPITARLVYEIDDRASNALVGINLKLKPIGIRLCPKIAFDGCICEVGLNVLKEGCLL